MLGSAKNETKRLRKLLTDGASSIEENSVWTSSAKASLGMGVSTALGDILILQAIVIFADSEIKRFEVSEQRLCEIEDGVAVLELLRKGTD